MACALRRHIEPGSLALLDLPGLPDPGAAAEHARLVAFQELLRTSAPNVHDDSTSESSKFTHEGTFPAIIHNPCVDFNFIISITPRSSFILCCHGC